MPVLHNRVSQKELKEKLALENFKRITVSFYKYFNIENPTEFRNEMYQQFEELQIFGRIYIAHEGINAQISIPEMHFQNFKDRLFGFSPELNLLRLNIAVDDDGKSFWVLKIKVRNKIVADGLDDITFNPSDTGTYLKADEYNNLSEKEGTIIIDMRNHYEYEVGHFKNAIEIPSDTFKEQLPMAVDMFKDKKDEHIIMYCTGGIRCEKASAYFKHNGFKNVYHVEGGIIEYANKAKELGLDNKFIGKNFVFDQRMGEKISDDIIAECHQCGSPCDTHVNCANDGCHLLFIQCENCQKKYEGCCSNQCQEVNQLPESERIELRKGKDKGMMIFNKAKNNRLRPTKAEIRANIK